ncbi:hypothetical protein jhhlp_001004 [Lomentospora prolificans]|uniref:DUF726 domain-containing protein n=1 Tax=Lomentospora prolificans TaxID=41688 RepID=A0A2N3NK28_9PEZI|nr:hypothetical protein jhhlp_001004 [Lomentospora prolificans]
MPPSATEPRQLVVVLNPARRKALYQLSNDIITQMRTQLELKDGSDEDSSLTETDDWSDNDTLYDGERGSQPFAPQNQGPPRRSNTNTLPSRKLLALRAEAVAFLNRWAHDFMKDLKEIVLEREDAKILEERTKRLQRLQSEPEPSFYGDDLIAFDGESETTSGRRSDIATLQSMYKPVPTRLETLSFHDRRDMLSCMLLLLLSKGSYLAHARIFVLYLTSSLKLPIAVLLNEETEIAKSLLSASAQADQTPHLSAEAEAEKRRQEGQASRFWKVGLASVAGAAVIGITGGLAAPVVAGAIGGLMGSVGLGGVASFLGIFWMNGALVGTLFGAFGAKMTGRMMDNYAKEVEDFCFIPLQETTRALRDQGDQARRLRVTIGINGWLTDKDDITKPWSGLGDDSEVFALRYEMDKLLTLGQALEGMVSSYAWKTVKLEILRRTVLASLWAALWPAYILSVAANIDNPFNLALNRSEKAGRVLADALINKVQGERPVTLVGYSLGARAIYTCLRTLEERKAFGLIETVVLIGAPVPSDVARWQKLRSVVAGNIFNVYTSNDYILGFVYRTHSLQLGVAGLQSIQNVKGIRNLDLSTEVSGHLRYPNLISRILTRCGFPGVNGGDRPIEREEDLNAAAQEPAAGGSGTGDVGLLIDFDEVPEPKSLASQVRPSVAPFTATHQATPSGSDPPRRPARPGPSRANAPIRASTQDTYADPLSGTPFRTMDLPVRGSRPQADLQSGRPSPAKPHSPQLRVLEPASLVDPPASAPVVGTSSRPELARNPLSDSYVGTLDTYDGASDEDGGGGIRMVSYDSD